MGNTTRGAHAIAEVTAPLDEGDIEAAISILGVCQETYDLATELTEIADNVRNGVQQCPGKCPGGACGLSPIQQEKAFWRKPPPTIIKGQRYDPRDL